MWSVMSLIRFTLVSTFLLLCSASGAFAELLSQEDRQVYRAAFVFERMRSWDVARRIAEAAKERLPSKVLLWRELSLSDSARFSEIVAFADENRDWPLLRAFRQHAEEVMVDVPDSEVRAYFDKHPPVTPKGKLRLAEILAGSDQRETLAALVRDMWTKPDLSPDDEDVVLARYADIVRAQDHIARLDLLIWEGQLSAARRQMQRVPEDWRLLAEARLALSDMQDGAADLVARIPSQFRNDPGLILEHARWYRRRDLLEEATNVLQSPPQDLVRPGAWWAERDVLVRKLVDERKDRAAYELASWRGLKETGSQLADAEFLSGWIALRRLNRATTAYEHFMRLYAGVKLPQSRSRGAYWAGRSAEVLGLQDAARGWLTSAAEHGTTYYGQLAAARLETAASPDFPSEPQPSPAESDAFERQDLVRAARMLAEIDQQELAKVFLLQVNSTAKTPVDYELVATLAEAISAPDVGIAAAKRAGRDGIPPLAQGFPLISLDAKSTAEPPFVLAIARQESSFDKAAISRSDARGLMQLKPSTARDMAKSLGIPFSADRLLTDSTYNLTLGQGYLDKLLDTFGGSYMLTAAAYNAGPRRVKEWLETYGDPRIVEPVDWIESLPFQETRNYVQRVLENLQVYRLRLGDRERAFTLADDLRR
jgi:soluble lytic murein transglycosylase